jgi:hypothetical protein
MLNDLKQIQKLYESHFYNDLDDDTKDKYYSLIKDQIEPFVKKCHELAIKIQKLSFELESLSYTDEFKQLKETVENYTENPNVEMREIIGFLVGKKRNLDHCVYELADDNIGPFLTDILTGNKLQ